MHEPKVADEFHINDYKRIRVHEEIELFNTLVYYIYSAWYISILLHHQTYLLCDEFSK